eukprot:TRINITY_DN3857_c0_g2_i6.p1 TRINITY_DN3857_c0_g2~~TRINITY_DN3857_c0_g2_i6.p1  ORF type:complete len:118 (-),score=13.20 TRINITY_DN3857_c0_g2_i6:208-561(-)
MQLRELTVSEYEETCDKFHKLRLPTLQEPSVITMQTQKEVVLEESFDKGLLLCKNHNEVVRYMLPLIGHVLFIKRCGGSQINPQMIQVEIIAKHQGGRLNLPQRAREHAQPRDRQRW